MHGSCRLHSCVFCRRLFDAARPCPVNGRAAGDDHHFSVPLGILAGLVIGIASAILVRREGFPAFSLRRVGRFWSSAASLVCCLAFRTCYRTKLHASMANNFSCGSNFARHRLLRFRISLMVTAFGQVCTSTIGNPNSHSSTGAPSQKMPNRSQSRDVLPCSRIARADRSSHRSVMRRKRRSSSS